MQVNLVVIQSLFILSTPVLSQYNTEIRPDVTFGDHNDRFDVSDLVSYQNKYFRADGSIDYRRTHGSKYRKFGSETPQKWVFGSERKRKKYAEQLRKEREEQLNKLANIILLKMKSTRRAGQNDFDHDNGEDKNHFNEHLEKAKRDLKTELNEDLREPFDYRTDKIPDTFNYAFPIELEVQGYLMPFENQ